MFNQLEGTVINKSVGLIGKSIDQRSQFYDVATNSYRNYTSTSEVLARLTGGSPAHTVEIRKGQFPIYVTSGGVMNTYYFKDGTDDINLVPFFPETTTTSINEGSAF